MSLDLHVCIIQINLYYVTHVDIDQSYGDVIVADYTINFP